MLCKIKHLGKSKPDSIKMIREKILQQEIMLESINFFLCHGNMGVFVEAVGEGCKNVESEIQAIIKWI